MKIISYIKSNSKILLIISGISLSIYAMFYLDLDVTFIAMITLLLGYITNLYSSLVALIGLIPIVGPLIVKVLTIPIFWIVNSVGYIFSTYAIKRDSQGFFQSNRMIAIYILFGIIIGYILGYIAHIP